MHGQLRERGDDGLKEHPAGLWRLVEPLADEGFGVGDPDLAKELGRHRVERVALIAGGVRELA